MMKSKRLITELYALLLYADRSFIRMNSALFRFHYEIVIVPLDEAERKFREVFGLPAYEGQLQDTSIPCGTAVTQEFYERIRLERPDGEQLLERGYIVLLRKNKAWDWIDQLNDRCLVPEMDGLRRFASRLENSLRLNRHGLIVIGEIFTYIPSANRVVRSAVPHTLMPVQAGQYEYQEKDNYSLKLWLDIEEKISGYISLAMQTFLTSFQLSNIRLRYLQLLLTLELCFTRASGANTDTVCRYASILLAHDKSQFLTLYDEIQGLYGMREDIMQGQAFESLDGKTDRLEELTRDILKKMIKLNPNKRESLIESLKIKRLNA